MGLLCVLSYWLGCIRSKEITLNTTFFFELRHINYFRDVMLPFWPTFTQNLRVTLTWRKVKIAGNGTRNFVSGIMPEQSSTQWKVLSTKIEMHNKTSFSICWPNPRAHLWLSYVIIATCLAKSLNWAMIAMDPMAMDPCPKDPSDGSWPIKPSRLFLMPFDCNYKS